MESLIKSVKYREIEMNSSIDSSYVEITFEFVSDLIKSFCSLCENLDKTWVNWETIAKYVCKSVKKEMLLLDLYNYIADYCASKVSYHPDYNRLASKICIYVLHKRTNSDFGTVIESLHNNIDKNGDKSPLISDEIFNIVKENSLAIQKQLDYTRDYYFDYFGIKTLERSYLYKIHYMKKNNKVTKVSKICERPQHLFMRVALGIHGDNLQRVFETYNLLSNKYFVHATPTLFNAGTIRSQMSSCYLIHAQDSIEGIFNTVSDIAKISKWAGGIGVTLSDIRAKGSLIRKTNGTSDGIIGLCRLLNEEAKYVNQGGKRNGAFAVYLEPWHADIFDFCELRKNTKDERLKARDLFLALWIPDIFMKRVMENGIWSLMCPDECPNLTSTYGDEFEALYLKYESEGRFKKQLKAVTLWYHILGAQIETGMPYMLYKDHANKKSNQKNSGVLKCSNLCSEILENITEDQTAVCNLASFCLPKFIELDSRTKIKTFNYNKIIEVAKVIVRNLDIIITKNFYPTDKTHKSNMKYRPIGIGVQGLADVYNIMGYPFESLEAINMNKMIFESIYYGCVKASCELAEEQGYYDLFPGSPASQGQFQFHLWGINENDLSGRYDWKTLIDRVKTYGLRNSLLTALMPTATTSQIMGNSEAIDPYLSNVYTRYTLAGEFIVINENLINDLIRLGIWSEEIRTKIIVLNGSISGIREIPENIKNIYKTAFEIKLKSVIQQAIDRGCFVDQSQSLNLYMEDSDFDRLTSAHFFGWEHGIKTGMYYLRSRPSVDPIQFGIDIRRVRKIKEEAKNVIKERNEQMTKPKMCRIRPGVKVSECVSCT